MIFTADGYKLARRALLPHASNDITRPNLYGIAVGKTKAYGHVLFATDGHALRVSPLGAHGALDGYGPDVRPFVITRNRLTPTAFKEAGGRFQDNGHSGVPVDFEQVVPQFPGEITLRAERTVFRSALERAGKLALAANAVRHAGWKAAKDQHEDAKRTINQGRLSGWAAKDAAFAERHAADLREWKESRAARKAAGGGWPMKRPVRVRLPKPELDKSDIATAEPKLDSHVFVICEGTGVTVAPGVFDPEKREIVPLAASRVTFPREHVRVVRGAGDAAAVFAFDAKLLARSVASFDSHALDLHLNDDLDPLTITREDGERSGWDLAVVMSVRIHDIRKKK